MVFTSPIFLFLFLPVTLAVNFLLPARLRNAWLLLASLVFYAWGEMLFTLVMLFSIVVNYGLRRSGSRRSRARSVPAPSRSAYNLALLAVMKYGGFAVANLERRARVARARRRSRSRRSRCRSASRSSRSTRSATSSTSTAATPRRSGIPLDLALYFLMFPHLIAGPIVRYHHVARQLAARTVDGAEFALGVRRFVVGLGKKMLIANTLAVPADAIFALPAEQLTPGDGLARASPATRCRSTSTSPATPTWRSASRTCSASASARTSTIRTVAQSIREFWRRWHISLSTWFRDYLFIPMGGNRRSEPRVYANLLTVFVLCGLWHGASWTFVVWGLWHGAFQILERLGLDRLLARVPRAAPARLRAAGRHARLGPLPRRHLRRTRWRSSGGSSPTRPRRRRPVRACGCISTTASRWRSSLGCIGATPLVPRLWAWRAGARRIDDVLSRRAARRPRGHLRAVRGRARGEHLQPLHLLPVLSMDASGDREATTMRRVASRGLAAIFVVGVAVAVSRHARRPRYGRRRR